ncbi:MULTISPECIES: hypothetical protein [unclassified Rathayibacter]|uniref:hypothetical protein n=1 Tax=unclassified Rathayibacter TaxID=2609250 RepID=UPI0006F94E60|nr:MULTISPECIES: hypothetical protein [unclassified Rathayibacter]KQP97592.1 hypothetical protein ASF42_18125 [Rathayibacter sp. Leaf294]KQS07264.1 hypothetical protein ASG06_18860 [Rathayibacter sp. Leaf185]
MTDVSGDPRLRAGDEKPDAGSAGVVETTAAERTPRAETIEELRAERDALLNDPLDAWLKHMHVGGVVASAPFEQTLSWRVTKPLRAVRLFQLRAAQLGVRGAVGHTARYAARRLGRRG